MPKDGILKGKDEFIFIFFIKADPKGFSLLKDGPHFSCQLVQQVSTNCRGVHGKPWGYAGCPPCSNFFFKSSIIMPGK